MLNQPFDNLAEPDLQRLVDNLVAESRHIEFKRDLPGGSDSERRKFLWNVTSFANAQGGDLIYGIDAPQGIATDLPGIETDDPDAAIQRLDNMLQASVAPRLIGVRMRWVPLANDRQVLVVRIPAGLAAPHRETFQNQGRFYTRNNAGKSEMDVHDLRHAFTESQGLPGRFRQLHAEAIARAKGHEMPLQIAPQPTAVVSVIPMALFREEREIPVIRDHAVLPIEPREHSSVDMIEGVMVHTPIIDGTLVRSFAITYRTGRVDVAWTIGRESEDQGQKQRLVFAPSFEQGLLDAAHAPEARLRQYGVEGPWVILATVIRAWGYNMVLGDGYPTKPAYKKEVLLGELRTERTDEEALLPIAKNFWLLFGERRPEGRALGAR